MHKLTKTLAFLGLLAPLGASALGVGDIRLHSALNESLDAEIPLVLSGADSLNDIKVTLASPEAFAKAGLERHYFLTKLQFSPFQTANGGYAIRVSSRDVMREPFLNFLVEVNWPQGRMVREFTALLDPPSQMQDEAVAETEPAYVQRPVRQYDRVAEISRSGSGYTAPPSRRSAQRPVSSAPRQAPAASPLPPASEDQLTNEIYGPVRRDENLWSIARSLNSDSSLTHEQMVLALYRANPQAFPRGINSLRAGSSLRMPSREFIAQLSPQQAQVEFARLQGWNTGRMAMLRTPEMVEPEGQQGQLRLLAPADTKGATAGRDAKGGKAKGDLALEVAETAKQENEEFRSRLNQMEQKLAEMQRLLSFKDEQIASLQAQQRASTQPAQPPVATSPKEPPPKPAVPQTAPTEIPTPPPVQAPVSTPSTTSSAGQQTHTPAPTPPSQPTGQAAPAGTQAEPPKPAPVTPPVAPSQPVVAPKPKPVVTPPPAAQRPKMAEAEESDWLVEPIYLGGAGALAAGLVALLIRRRRNAMIAETESILLAAERASRQTSGQFSAIRQVVEPAIEPIASPKSSFLSEFTPSDFDTLGAESDEVDPISEADVYLAYGRYKQAEELIKHAISQHPERDECKLKLLEIYHTTENRTAFESYAKELKAQHKDSQADFWGKVVEMGRELVPGSVLFQASTPGILATAAAPRPAEKSLDSNQGLGSLDLSDDLIDDLRRFEFEFSDLLGGSTGTNDLEPLDFGIKPTEQPTRQTPSTPPPPPKAADKLADLEFDLDSLGLGKNKPSSPPEAVPVEPEPLDLDNLIAFDFGSKTPPKPAEEPIQEGFETQADKTIDDILRDLTDSLRQETPAPAPPRAKPEPPPEPEPSSSAQDTGLSSLGFDLNLFEPDLELELESAEETRTGKEEGDDLYSSLTDMDQYETKLDLAKAYADMDDVDSAGEILHEVMANGNDKQKTEARQLLAKMGKADAA